MLVIDNGSIEKFNILWYIWLDLKFLLFISLYPQPYRMFAPLKRIHVLLLWAWFSPTTCIKTFIYKIGQMSLPMLLLYFHFAIKQKQISKTIHTSY